MYTIERQHDTAGALIGLRHTYGVTTSATNATRARRLAPTIETIRPGIFAVGACTVDLWRESCTCKTMRDRKTRGIEPTARPCPHFLALYVSGEWSPGFNPTVYLKSQGIEQPDILETHCRATLPACYPPAPQGFRLLEIVDDWATLENIATGTHASIESAKLRYLRPLYAEDSK